MVGRGVLALLFYEDPPTLPNQPFSNFVQSSFPVASNPHPQCSFCLVSLVEWVIVPHLIYIFNIMDLHMLSLGTLYQKDLDCVLCNKASSLLRSDTWCGFLLVFWFDITHTHTHIDTQHTQGGSRLTDLYEYIFTLPAMSSQQLSLLHWMNNLLISKIYLPQFCLFFFFFF